MTIHRLITPLDPAQFGQLGEAIAQDGIGAHEARVRDAAAQARRAGVNPVLVEILATRSEPAVARERAFGRIGIELITRRARAQHGRSPAGQLVRVPAGEAPASPRLAREAAIAC